MTKPLNQAELLAILKEKQAPKPNEKWPAYLLRAQRADLIARLERNQILRALMQAGIANQTATFK